MINANLKIAQMIALAMLVGSIPVGYLVLHLKSPGAARELGRDSRDLAGKLGGSGCALITMLDAVKGFVPVYLAKTSLISPPICVIVGIVAVLSATFPYWCMFKPSGGGIGAALGVIIAFNPIAGLCALGVWVVGLFIRCQGRTKH